MKFNRDDWFRKDEDGTEHFVIAYQWLSYLVIVLLLSAFVGTINLLSEYHLWGYVITFFVGAFYGSWIEKKQNAKTN